MATKAELENQVTEMMDCIRDLSKQLGGLVDSVARINDEVLWLKTSVELLQKQQPLDQAKKYNASVNRMKK